MQEQQEFQQRRQRLLSVLGDDAIAIIFSGVEYLRSADAYYPFSQNKDFYYLTGFNEPEAVAVLIPNGQEGEFILFNRRRDPAKEVWDGYRAGQEGACAEYGADAAYPIDEIDQHMPALMLGRTKVFYPVGEMAQVDQRVLSWSASLRRQVRAGVPAPQEFISLGSMLHEMRLFKSEHEQALMREAARISAQAHCRAMQVCQPDMMEYQLEAELVYEFQRNGCRRVAYDSIVGGGSNACILHYIRNDQALCDGDLVLIDAGGEYKQYAADITRTFPVNGRFTPEQKAIYDIVLAAQVAGIEAIRPGVPWDAVQAAIVPIITQGLIDLEILYGDLDTLIEQKAYENFYLHRSGHWLGLDVHDVGSYKQNGQWRDLQAGMVLTVEPGIYIAADNQAVDERWWNIGVRIEDDVFVTENGHEVLSADVPKARAEIEALMAGR